MTKTNIAIVLFNIGGPDNLKNVKKYLFNFFSDKFIITAPYLIRKIIASLISLTRSNKTTEIYKKIGGKSVATENTIAQAKELEKILNTNQNNTFYYKIYVCMSYWHPMAEQTIKEINLDQQQYNFEQIIYLPLYPQFSTTTTKSSFYYWNKTFAKKANKQLLHVKQKYICCYYDDLNFINAHVNIIAPKFKQAFECLEKNSNKLNGIRILFSAHSIPEKLTYSIKQGGSGDPYQAQIIKTVNLLMKKIQSIFSTISIEYLITYQSKIGPIKWLSPSTEEEILKCTKEKTIPIIVPITFVSENSETLYELDIEYKELLQENDMPHFFRCPTLSLNEIFIKGLENLIIKAQNSQNLVINGSLEQSCSCDNQFSSCPKINSSFLKN